MCLLLKCYKVILDTFNCFHRTTGSVCQCEEGVPTGSGETEGSLLK